MMATKSETAFLLICWSFLQVHNFDFHCRYLTDLIDFSTLVPNYSAHEIVSVSLWKVIWENGSKPVLVPFTCEELNSMLLIWYWKEGLLYQLVQLGQIWLWNDLYALNSRCCSGGSSRSGLRNTDGRVWLFWPPAKVIGESESFEQCTGLCQLGGREALNVNRQIC